MQQHWLVRPAAYLPVWQAMRDFTQNRTDETEDELWLVEHAPVYTLGQAGREDHILNPGAIPIVRCDRGGQVTYHGPGQIVLYTLVDLHRARISAHGFVHLLEQAVLDLLVRYGVSGACCKPGAPGVYVPQSALADPRGAALAKIAALGIKIHKGCAYHGVALNVGMNLRPFLGIDPCGYAGLQTVDMAACGVNTTTTAAGNLLAGLFSNLWESGADSHIRKQA